MTLVMINYDNINALQLVAPNFLGSYIHQDHDSVEDVVGFRQKVNNFREIHIINKNKIFFV